MRERRLPEPACDDARDPREIIAAQDEVIREVRQERDEFRQEVCRLRAFARLLEKRLAIATASHGLAYWAGQRDALARLGMVPPQGRHRGGRRGKGHLSIVPGAFLATAGVTAGALRRHATSAIAAGMVAAGTGIAVTASQPSSSPPPAPRHMMTASASASAPAPRVAARQDKAQQPPPRPRHPAAAVPRPSARPPASLPADVDTAAQESQPPQESPAAPPPSQAPASASPAAPTHPAASARPLHRTVRRVLRRPLHAARHALHRAMPHAVRSAVPAAPEVPVPSTAVPAVPHPVAGDGQERGLGAKVRGVASSAAEIVKSAGKG